MRKATMRDLPLLIEWQTQPHVREWWDGDEPFDQEEITDPRVARWIFEIEGRPFAFMQDYAVDGIAGYDVTRGSALLLSTSAIAYRQEDVPLHLECSNPAQRARRLDDIREG